LSALAGDGEPAVADQRQQRVAGSDRGGYHLDEIVAQLNRVDVLEDLIPRRTPRSSNLKTYPPTRPTPRPTPPCASRTRARFADLHHKCEQIQTQLDALAETTPPRHRPRPGRRTPCLGSILPAFLTALKARLFAAFDLEILWNEPGDQATVYAEIREHPLGHPAILDPAQDGYHDTSTQARPVRT
jgi:hypothetical protein